MDKTAPREEPSTKPVKPARVALNVLALCFALSVLGRGLGESFTVFLKPISESFGWDRAQVVSVYSLAALAGGLASPLIGRLFDRSGPRAVYSLGLLLLGGAFLVAAHAQHLWQFQLSIGICVGFGIAFIFCFFSIGLTTRLRELAGVGSKPFIGFTAGVVVNVILGFLLSAVVFANYWTGVFTAPE